MKSHEGGGPKDNSRANETSTMHQVRTQGSNDSIEGPKIRGSGARSIQNQQLMFEQQRLRNDGTSAARRQEFSDGRNEINK